MAISITHAKRERAKQTDAIYHITTRCNNKEPLIEHERDFQKYKYLLSKTKEAYNFRLHNYVVMHNHTHLIINVSASSNVSEIMHSINRQYARWYNERHNRKGHFWEDRFYGELIKDDVQLLAVMRYIDLNPARARLCINPSDWPHSGAKLYLEGYKNNLIDIPETYLALGKTGDARQKAYAAIFPFNLQNLTRLK